MQCLPDNLRGRRYYHPTEEGIEKRIKARLDEIRQVKARSPQRHGETEKKSKSPDQG
jgi:putative ATPase